MRASKRHASRADCEIEVSIPINIFYYRALNTFCEYWVEPINRWLVELLNFALHKLPGPRSRWGKCYFRNSGHQINKCPSYDLSVPTTEMGGVSSLVALLRWNFSHAQGQIDSTSLSESRRNHVNQEAHDESQEESSDVKGTYGAATCRSQEIGWAQGDRCYRQRSEEGHYAQNDQCNSLVPTHQGGQVSPSVW